MIKQGRAGTHGGRISLEMLGEDAEPTREEMVCCSGNGSPRARVAQSRQHVDAKLGCSGLAR